MLSAAANYYAGCTCTDCSGGKDKGQQRAREAREWHKELADEDAWESNQMGLQESI